MYLCGRLTRNCIEFVSIQRVAGSSGLIWDQRKAMYCAEMGVGSDVCVQLGLFMLLTL